MANVNYPEELKEQVSKIVVEGRSSATGIAIEMGIDKNTVCRWVKEYRKTHGLPEDTERERDKELRTMIDRCDELERELRKMKKELADEREKVEILKKVLHISE